MSKKILFIGLISFLLLFSSFVYADYIPQENIPGQGPASNFMDYLHQLYSFGVIAAIVLAIFMISFGAFSYIFTSVGNASKMGDAKQIIFDSLLGLLIAFSAYLLLFLINPDMIQGTLSSVLISGSTTSSPPENYSGSPTPPPAGGVPGGNGTCSPVASGACSAENLKKYFGSEAMATEASIICGFESGGNADSSSKTDVCLDGKTFSFGLFQVNLRVHKVGSLNCPKAFEKIGNGSYDAAKKRYNCKVVDETLYNQCVVAVKNPEHNIKYAKRLYDGRGGNWNDWACTSFKCGLNATNYEKCPHHPNYKKK